MVTYQESTFLMACSLQEMGKTFMCYVELAKSSKKNKYEVRVSCCDYLLTRLRYYCDE